MTTQPAAHDLVEDSSSQQLENTLSAAALPQSQPQPQQDQQQTTINASIDPLSTTVKLTGRLLNFTRLNIAGNDIKAILTKIAQKLGRQRQSNLPVIVSCQHKLNLAQLWGGLWALGLQPIGIITGQHDKEAHQLRIAIFPADGQRIDGKAPTKKPIATGADNHTDNKTNNESRTSSTEQPTDTTTQAITSASQHPLTYQPENNPDVNQIRHESPNSPDKFVASQHQQSQLEGDLVHRQILRSGQSINHVGGDVILTKGINAGAEAITDYSLHVYGKAEGRLVAGATGDTNAKIFCLRFNPSLVSVAGTYCLKENIPAQYLDKAVQVSYLEGQGLIFELME